MDGFKVTCLKCGKEIVITDNSQFHNTIWIYPSSYEGDVGIHCEHCKNCIEK